MHKCIETINELRVLSGNAQLDYLEQNKSDLLKEILEYTYDPHRKYKIDENKYNSVLDEHSKINPFFMCELDKNYWKSFKQQLDHLASLKAVKNEDVIKTRKMIEDCAFSTFLKMVLFKDLRINMNIKKFQKVWSNFCTAPQVQLAQKWENQHFENGFYSRKFDGKRMYIQDNIPYSRSNIECHVNPVLHILEQVEELLDLDGLVNGDYFVLDGECLYFENGKENFQKGISLCQSEERKFGCDNICYVIFDMIPKENFNTKTQWHAFKTEYDMMIKAFADLNKPSPSYSLIPTKMSSIFIARQDKDMSALSKLCYENNWEGLMYRNGDSPYEFKRSKNLLKIKQMQDIELKLLRMEEGTGKYEGMLGAFIVDYQGYELNVGSGFTDDQRTKYWNNQQNYIGKFVKVQYFEKTKNQQGQESLRFPVYMSFRDPHTLEEFI